MSAPNIVKAAGGDWFHEIWQGAAGGMFRVNKLLYADNSEHQNILVFENDVFGRMLAIDNVVQVAEADEFIYHEMITHVGALAHGGVKRVLIVGGGDGGAIRELFRHKTIEAVTLVEIDKAVIDLCAQWMPMVADGAFDDPRLNLVIGDGAKFVTETDERFDMIIVDSTDPVGPGAVLFTEEFYRGCHRALAPGGILVTQSGLPFVQAKEFTGAFGALSEIFAYATGFQIVVPSFWGGPMILGFATDDAALVAPPVHALAARKAAVDLTCKYYTPGHHRSAFQLPSYVSEMLPHAEKLLAEGLIEA
ncbi:MAG: polyamine aminopropyltransferase [Pseudomonadota bacterium]